MYKANEHSLEFLLDFDGRIHHLEAGYWLKFEIKRIDPTKERPHDLRYSFTLHDPKGKRLLGFDNAHSVPIQRSRYKKKAIEHDHWHRTEKDEGIPYKFIDADTLLADFETGVLRILSNLGVGSTVLSDSDTKKRR